MLANKVKETTSTTGAGSFTTTGAVAGFQTFNNAFGLNQRFAYWALDETANTWETGIGYLSGTTTLVRETVLDNSSGGATAINFANAPSLFNGLNKSNALPLTGAEPAKYIVSQHLTNHGSGDAAQQDANEIWYYPFLLMNPDTYDAFSLQVSVGGGNCRVALYDVKGGLPNNIIAVHDTTLSISTSGQKIATFDGGSVFLPAGWYYIGVVTSGTPSFRGGSGNSIEQSPLGIDASQVGSTLLPYGGLSKTFTYGAMPDPADITSISYFTNIRVPSTSLRQG